MSSIPSSSWPSSSVFSFNCPNVLYRVTQMIEYSIIYITIIYSSKLTQQGIFAQYTTGIEHNITET
jgi:hypothetical protein